MVTLRISALNMALVNIDW
ncbi:hypothetical protein C5167_024574 [Papaver somniferum]|uniref:Uncharacterized protein n=1 Tax=Papaver somniferum TaxID=3469 RepID=A0A4Y7JP01_PAPSO|nr:hypothetical protein C5167_024574 [Papaver somniferum]